MTREDDRLRQANYRARKKGFANYDEMQAAKESRKEIERAYRGGDLASAQQRQAESDRLFAAANSEENGFGLWGLDKQTNGDAVTTLAQEKANAILWCRILKFKDIADGTTLTNLMQRLYHEWNRQATFHLWNPFSQKFSPDWTLETGETFESSYKPIEGSDTLLLDPKDFDEAASQISQARGEK